MKNLIIAIIVIALIVLGVVYYVNKDAGDALEAVDESQVIDNSNVDEGTFMTDEADVEVTEEVVTEEEGEEEVIQ
ncbi:MAG: hypothetical protein WDZ85_03080 [Candidatus Paceibacterota bacterium]